VAGKTLSGALWSSPGISEEGATPWRCLEVDSASKESCRSLASNPTGDWVSGGYLKPT